MTAAVAGAATDMQIMKAHIQTGKEGMTHQQGMKREGIALLMTGQPHQQITVLLEAITETTIRRGRADMQSQGTKADSTATETIN